jgi:hypothetical protein
MTTLTPPYPSDQHNNASAIPVRVVSGGGGGSSGPYTYTPLGYQQITSLAAVASLTPPAGATIAFVTVEGAPVRYRDDGTAPTTTVGMPIGIGSQLTYSGNLAAIEFIQQSASATLDVSYYK